MRRLVPVLLAAFWLCVPSAQAQRAAASKAPAQQVVAGTATAPAANPLFQNNRISVVALTFEPKDFAALAPHRGPSGGSSQSWLQGPEGKRNGLSATRGLDFPYSRARVTIDGREVKNIGVRYKGNGTFMLGQQVGKVSLKLDFNHFVKGQKLDGLKMLNLHSNVTDPSYMNEVLAFRLFQQAGVPAPRTSYAKVHVTVPGRYDNVYYGLFTMVEAPDDVFVAARGMPAGGAIFKPVTENLFAKIGSGTEWARYNQTYDPKTTLTAQQQQRVMNFSQVVTSATDAQFAESVNEFLDLDNAARYLAMTVWLSDLDGILGSGQNYYLHLDPKTNKFSFMAWDQDHSFGQFFTGSQSGRERLDIHRPAGSRGFSRFLDRLFKVPAFKTRYIAYLTEFSKTLLVPERLSAQVDEVAAFIRPAIKEESALRLANFELAVAGKTPHADDSMFNGANIPIKPFAKARAASVAQQLGGK